MARFGAELAVVVGGAFASRPFVWALALFRFGVALADVLLSQGRDALLDELLDAAQIFVLAFVTERDGDARGPARAVRPMRWT